MTDSKKRLAVDRGTKDRITELPRNILDHILECMPIQDAARTSILSRNWRYIWATHPRVVLDQHFFKWITRNKPIIHSEYMKNIISKIFLLHSGPILRFTLCIPAVHFDLYPDVDQWMLFLSRSGLKNLTFYNLNHTPYVLPSCVLLCPGLTHLVLWNCIFKPPVMFGGFRNLISLSLTRITFRVTMAGNIVPSAPLLMRLIFIACTDIHNFSIYAPRLQTLYALGNNDLKLSHLRIGVNLIQLNIAFWRKLENSALSETISLSKLLTFAPRISIVFMDGFFLKYLAADNGPKELSNCLKHIQLSGVEFTDLDQISCIFCLLRSSLKLQKLEITASAVANNAMDLVLNYLEAPDCMDQTLDQLKTVKIRLSEGSRAELLFIKILLSCSPFLEEVIVEQSGVVDANKGFRISRELMRFSRASKKAEIIYMEPGHSDSSENLHSCSIFRGLLSRAISATDFA